MGGCVGIERQETHVDDLRRESKRSPKDLGGGEPRRLEGKQASGRIPCSRSNLSIQKVDGKEVGLGLIFYNGRREREALVRGRLY